MAAFYLWPELSSEANRLQFARKRVWWPIRFFSRFESSNNFLSLKKGRGLRLSLTSLVAHYCWSLSRFLLHEATRNVATPPGWDASPSQVTSQHFVRSPWQFAGTHLLLGGERHCESEVSCPRTEHNDPGQGSNPDLSIRSPDKFPVRKVEASVGVWGRVSQEALWVICLFPKNKQLP